VRRPPFLGVPTGPPGIHRGLLAYIDPCLPYAEYTASGGPSPTTSRRRRARHRGSLVHRRPRHAAGQYSTARSQPEKHAGFRRQTGRVATLGTLIHYAKLGGWRPPPQPLNAVTRGRRQKAESKLEELPNPGYDDLPHFLRRVYDHLGPLVEGLPRDLVTVVSLSALAILWPGIRFENLPLSLFVNLDDGAGVRARVAITTELTRLLQTGQGHGRDPSSPPARPRGCTPPSRSRTASACTPVSTSSGTSSPPSSTTTCRTRGASSTPSTTGRTCPTSSPAPRS
jgi:hypothetical protein